VGAETSVFWRFFQKAYRNQGVTLTTHLCLVPRSGKRGALPPCLLWIVMVWCLCTGTTIELFSNVICFERWRLLFCGPNHAYVKYEGTYTWKQNRIDL
jgi:hypothetical protein